MLQETGAIPELLCREAHAAALRESGGGRVRSGGGRHAGRHSRRHRSTESPGGRSRSPGAAGTHGSRCRRGHAATSGRTGPRGRQDYLVILQ